MGCLCTLFHQSENVPEVQIITWLYNVCVCVHPPACVVIRELCDIGDLGKLTREQFALALHLINQKLTKGLEPPQTLSAEMIPPSDRLSIKQVGPPRGSPLLPFH